MVFSSMGPEHLSGCFITDFALTFQPNRRSLVQNTLVLETADPSHSLHPGCLGCQQLAMRPVITVPAR
jgi:hypothetical protein